MRLERLHRLLDEKDLEALLVSHPDNRRYLSGFTGSVGLLLVSQERALLITDFRYVEQAGEEAPDFEVVRLDRDFVELLPHLAEEVGARRIAFEGEAVNVAQHRRWQEAVAEVELVPQMGLIEGLREVKDEAELRLIREAVSLTDRALAYLLEVIAPGMSEREVAWKLEAFIHTHGAEGLAFPSIVASGPNAAKPHATPSERPLGTSEPIVLDLGARVHGYCSDMTRTIVIGPPDDKFREVHQAVLEAQLAALEALRPGMSGVEADRVAREALEASGYGDAFGHGLGHGVGLAVHEGPSASPRSQDVLRPGMTLTVEPGVYLPGWGGVRVEDLVVIGEGGAEILTRSGKDPYL